MIDRDYPEKSLLLQWGLPRDIAKYPAPEDLKRWRPSFTNTKSRQYQLILKWIDSLYDPAPNYEVKYSLPPKVVDKTKKDNSK